jgi:hypothetical protein
MIRKLLLITALLCFPAVAHTTVTTTASAQITYTGDGSTTVFYFTFPALEEDQIQATRVTISDSSETTLVQGTDFTVTLPVGSATGYITTQGSLSPLSALYQIRIERNTDATQETAFRNQGYYDPSALEDALDKLTMLIQEIDAQAGTSGAAAVATHEGEADPHSGYLLLAGRSGGQVAKGGTGSGDDLELYSTSHATKGDVIFGAAGTTCYDETNDYLGVGTCSPGYELHVAGDVFADTHVYVDNILYGGIGSGDDLQIRASSNATVGDVIILKGSGASTFHFDATNDRVTFGKTSVSAYGLDIDTDEGLAVGETDKVIVDHNGANAGVIFMEDAGANDNKLSLLGGDTTTEGSGITLHGESFSGNQDDVKIWGDQMLFQDEANTTFMTLTDDSLTYDGTMEFRKEREVGGAGVTIDITTDCNKVFMVNQGSTYTLPALSTDALGCEITFVMTGSAYDVAIAPNSADGIIGFCYYPDSTGSFTDGDGVIMTALDGEANYPIGTDGGVGEGMWVKLMAVDTDEWKIVGCSMPLQKSSSTGVFSTPATGIIYIYRPSP